MREPSTSSPNEVRATLENEWDERVHEADIKDTNLLNALIRFTERNRHSLREHNVSVEELLETSLEGWPSRIRHECRSYARTWDNLTLIPTAEAQS